LLDREFRRIGALEDSRELAGNASINVGPKRTVRQKPAFSRGLSPLIDCREPQRYCLLDDGLAQRMQCRRGKDIHCFCPPSLRRIQCFGEVLVTCDLVQLQLYAQRLSHAPKRG